MGDSEALFKYRLHPASVTPEHGGGWPEADTFPESAAGELRTSCCYLAGERRRRAEGKLLLLLLLLLLPCQRSPRAS